MWNHFHLLIHGELDDIVALVGSSCNSYVKYFNNKYSRSGHLCDERFWCEPIESDNYALACMRYIHRNPEKAGIGEVASYRWSSYRSFLLPNPTQDRALLLDMLGGPKEFVAFHSEDEERDFIDVDTLPIQHTDIEVDQLFNKRFGLTARSIGEITNKEKRNRLVLELRNLGCKTLQIQRLTGLSRGIIQRIV